MWKHIGHVYCAILKKLARKDTERVPLAGTFKLEQFNKSELLETEIFNIVCQATPETFDDYQSISLFKVVKVKILVKFI